MLKCFIEDIMSQIFLISNGYYNPTRIVILFSIINLEHKENKILKSEIVDYIYRYYIVNKDLAKHNPNLAIRQIGKYGINEFYDILDLELKDWDNYSKNHIIKYDSNYIYMDLDLSDSSIKDNLTIIGNMLFEKYFNKEFIPPLTIEEKELDNDFDIEAFGKGKYKFLALQDIQYCPLCEETNLDNLYVVHILPSKLCNYIEKKDKNNSMIFCKTHAIDYINKKFYFAENGFIKNISSNNVSSKMHLELNVRKKRQPYILKYLQYIKEEDNN